MNGIIQPPLVPTPAVAVLDARGRVLSWNAAAERLTGWPADRITGCPIPADGPAGLEGAESPFQDRLSAGAAEGFPVCLRGPEGSPLWFHAWASPIQGQDRFTVVFLPAAPEASPSAGPSESAHPAPMAQALREGEERFRQVLENGLDAAYRRDLRTDTYDYLSPVIEQVTGVSVERMRAMPVEEMMERIHPEDRERVREAIGEGMQSHRGKIEYRFRTDDGGYRWLADHFTLQTDEAGRPVSRGGYVRDITDHKQTEAALAEQGSKLRVALDSAELGTWVYTFEDQRWDLDERARALYRTAGMCVHHDEQTVRRILHNDDIDGMWARLRAAADPAGDGRYQAEYRVLQPDGSVRWLVAWGRVEFEGGGDQRRPVRMIGVSRDITARKRDERQAEHTRHWLERVADTTPDVIFILDLIENRNIYANRSLAELLGYTPAEYQQLSGILEKAITPEDLDTVRAFYRDMETAAPGDVRTLEHRTRHKDGSIRWIENRVTPFSWDAAGRLKEVLGLAHDVTDRKRADEALRRAYALIEGITKGTEDLIAAEDVDFRYTFFNDAYRQEFRKLWGQDLEVGTSMVEALAPWPEEQRKARELWSRALDGETFSVTTEFGPSEKAMQVYDLRFSPVYDDQGRQIGAAHILQNVTAKVHMQEHLRKSEEWLRLALDAGRIGTWDWNPQTGALQWSEGHYTLLGYRVGDLEPTYASFEDRIHPEDLGRQRSAIRAAMEDRAPYQCEFRVRWPDGSVRWVEARGLFVYDERGLAVRMYGILVDINEKKRTEEAVRRQAEELAAADQAKDTFLAMLAHELRNPLGAIGNAAALIDMRTRDQDTLRRPVEILNRQVKHTARLVDDLLDVSRITRGKLELRKEPMDLSEVTRRAAETARPQMEANRHRFTVSVPDIPLWVDGDAARLEQVVGNLLGNAARYTEPGGEVVISLTAQDAEAVIRVGDTGQGITTEMLPRIFEMFAQEDRSLDRSKGGLGIGLTLVRNLVEMHGGVVEAHSEGPGRGSEFIVRMPLLKNLPARRDTPRAAGPGPNRRVLTVEDNEGASSL